MSDQFLRVRDWDAIYENNRSRGYKRLNWVPIPNRMDGDGYTELVDHPGGAAHLGVWVAMVQVASRCEPRGVLMRDGGRPHDAASLARVTRLPAGIFDEAIPRLLGSIGWLESVSVDEIQQDTAGIPQDAAESGQFKYAERNGTERKRIELSSRVEPSFISDENTKEAQHAIGAHRGRNDEPDVIITREILSKFPDVEQFRAWVAGLGEGLDPKEIKGEGYGIYASDAQRWIENGGKRPRKRQARKTTPSPYFDPRSITDPSPSTCENTMDPETARRMAERRKTTPSPYFDARKAGIID